MIKLMYSVWVDSVSEYQELMQNPFFLPTLNEFDFNKGNGHIVSEEWLDLSETDLDGILSAIEMRKLMGAPITTFDIFNENLELVLMEFDFYPNKL